MARVALGDMDFDFAWHVHWAGSGGALDCGLCRRLCVAGVALGDMDLHFAWQVWHLVTWTFTLREWIGFSGALGCGLSTHTLHGSGTAWHLVIWAFTLRGRGGTCANGLVLVARWVVACRRTLCVAGMALW